MAANESSAGTLLFRVYHATTTRAAEAIEADGFRDTPGCGSRPPGVFVSDVPLTCADGIGERDAWFAIDVPCAHLEGREYQPAATDWLVWLVPAELLNAATRARLASDDVDALRDGGL